MAVRDLVAHALESELPAAPEHKGVALVGAGPGDPELITVKGRRLLAAADVVVADRLVPGLLLGDLRPDVEFVDAAKIPYGPSKAGHEALVALMAQDLEGTGVTANVLVPGGATNTNLIAPDTPYARTTLIQPEVMQAPVVWLASDASPACNGRRLIAYYWDERLPLEERLAKASAPAAWPQLGRQAISPGR